ncbi:MAG: hypothetical protein ACJ8HI_02710 [Massilia sp.]
MKATILVAMLAVVGLTACEKTTVNPPATVVQPTATVEKQVAVPVPVPVPGPAGPAGAPGTPGEKGEPGKAGDTVVVVPDAKPENK